MTTESTPGVTWFDNDYLSLLAYLTSDSTWVRETRGTVSYEGSRPFMMIMNWPYFPMVMNRKRKLNYYFAVAEWLWITLGMDELAPLLKYNRQMERFTDDGSTLSGAYGPRLIRDLPTAVGKILRDPDTRQAVCCTWQPELAGRSTKDTPCTMTFHFMAEAQYRNPDFRTKERQLGMVVSMRSNDSWLGLPYDVFTFTMLHRQVAKAVGMDVGRYTHIADSEHIYREHLDQAVELTTYPDLERLKKSTAMVSSWLEDPVPDLPILWEPAKLRAAREFFRQLPEKTEQEVYNFFDFFEWEGALPWFLFLRQKFHPEAPTTNEFLDVLNAEMKARKQ